MKARYDSYASAATEAARAAWYLTFDEGCRKDFPCDYARGIAYSVAGDFTVNTHRGVVSILEDRSLFRSLLNMCAGDQGRFKRYNKDFLKRAKSLDEAIRQEQRFLVHGIKK